MSTTASSPALRTRPPSDTPEAERMRRYRARKREAKASSPTPVTNADANAHVAPPAPAATPLEQPSATGGSAPWHTTEPNAGPGPEAFAVPLVLPPNESAPDAEPEPFAPPPPEEPAQAAPPVTGEDVALVVAGVMEFIKAGSHIAAIAYAPELVAIGIDPNSAVANPMVQAVVHKAVENVCIKYNIKLPYQDEAIVTIAVGVAALGFTKGRARIAERERGPVAAPANDNSHANANANANVYAPNVNAPPVVDVDASPVGMPAPAASGVD